MPIEATLEQMDRLEEGLTLTLEQVEDVARGQKSMGQSRTYSKKMVAYSVATYMKLVTGNIPGFWSGNNSSGPYARAVREICDILNLDMTHKSLQRAGEWAINELRD